MTVSTLIQKPNQRTITVDHEELRRLLDPDQSPDPVLYGMYARKLRCRGWGGQLSSTERAFLRTTRKGEQ